MVRGQTSIEYISIVALVLVITIPLVVIFYDKMSETESAINFNQAEQIVNRIADNAQNIFYLGEDAKTTLKVTMPKHVTDFSIGNNEVVLVVQSKGKNTDIVAYTPVNVSGNVSFHPGTHYIILESRGSYVEVYEE